MSNYPIIHGYTTDSLRELASTAARLVDGRLAQDHAHRYDLAYGAIAEALLTAPTPPHPGQLVSAGMTAISNETKAMHQLYGVANRDVNRGVASAPRFHAYWYGHTPYRGTPHWQDQVDERLTLTQAMATLSDPLRDALVALALCDDYQKAADALGINYKALAWRLRKARGQVLPLFLGPDEHPAHTNHADRRRKYQATHCPQGHEFTPENTRWEGVARRSRRCRACDHVRELRRPRRTTTAQGGSACPDGLAA